MDEETTTVFREIIVKAREQGKEIVFVCAVLETLRKYPNFTVKQALLSAKSVLTIKPDSCIYKQ